MVFFRLYRCNDVNAMSKPEKDVFIKVSKNKTFKKHPKKLKVARGCGLAWLYLPVWGRQTPVRKHTKIRAAPFLTMAKGKLGPTKRFGARYGRTVKHKLAKIERALKQNHECPYCMKKKVKRMSVGIWHCSKCKALFTGKAYTPESKQTFGKKTEELAISFEEAEEAEA